MKSKIVELSDGKKVTVNMLPVRKYGELLKLFKKLPEQLKKMTGKDNADLIEKIPSIIGESLDDVLLIIVFSTDLKLEDFDSYGLDDTIALFTAIIEVNNYQKTYDTIKKALTPQVA